MTISVWGWGSTTISTWGWGTPYNEYVPILLAAFIESQAHACVLNRDYVDILTRETGDIVFRVKPSNIPLRGYGEVLSRMNVGDILVRSKPDELLNRGYTEVINTLTEGDVILRVRPDQIPNRERDSVLSRLITSDITTRDTCSDDQ